jgi:uncharacterized membrane protein
VLRIIAAVAFVLAGLNHFRNPTFYQQIIPPSFPNPAALVVISGLCEIAGGLGLLVPWLRRWACWGLIALLIAVFPANIYMAVHPERFAEVRVPAWVLIWVRLPLQVVFITWVWFVGATENRYIAAAPDR